MLAKSDAASKSVVP